LTSPAANWADPLAPDEFRLLAEVGFVAAGRGMVDRASQIFQALIDIAPTRPLPHIGLSLALLNSGRADDALRVLERAEGWLKGAPGSDTPPQASDPRDDYFLLRAFYGVALKLSGRTSESFRILGELTHRPEGDHAGRIARSMLGISHLQEVTP